LAPPTEITKEIILLVEGKDEGYFFKYYRKFLRESSGSEWINLDKLQVICYDGIPKLRNTLKTIQDITGSELIQKIGIIRDAEDNAESAFIEIKKDLSESGLDVPRQPLIPTTGNPVIIVMITPENGAGSIEIIFLESVNQDPAFPCVTHYVDCLTPIYERNDLPKPKNIHKTKLHAFLSSRKEANISIGGAAQNGYWNFNSTAFNGIKAFLNQLVN
jgi:hypothetical protein